MIYNIDMKIKRVLTIVVFSLILLIILIVSFSYAYLNINIESDLNITFKTSRNYIEYYINGKMQYNIPPKNLEYIIDKKQTSCTNGTYSWDYDNWKPVIKGDNVSCKIYFKNINNIYNMYKTINNSVANAPQNGIYYFDSNGDLDYGNGTKITLNNKDTNIKGIVSVWNKKLIYACLKDNAKAENYSYYSKDYTITESDYPCSTTRYSELVTNSNLEYKSNFNYENMGKYSNGEILINGSVESGTTELIPIDPNKKYRVQVTMKTNDTAAYNYLGIREYGVKSNMIKADNVMYITGTDCYLTSDLNPGDTVVHLSTLENWQNLSPYYQRGIIFWNEYNDVEGMLPIHYYSSSYYYDLYTDFSKINKTNKTITLTKAWSSSKIPKGTYLNQSSSGGNYNYGILAYRQITTSYVTYSMNITGYAYNNSDNTKFKYGTHFINLLGLWSYRNGSANTINYIKNVSIKEIN